MGQVISAKVAAIIDDTTLVLNAGLEQGVKEGMGFKVVAQHQAVADPDSGEELGKWEWVKAQVEVIHVQERMCTVRSNRLDGNQTEGTLSSMMVQHSFGNYGQSDERRQPLQVRGVDQRGLPQNTPIVVGDLARSVVEGEGEDGGDVG